MLPATSQPGGPPLHARVPATCVYIADGSARDHRGSPPALAHEARAARRRARRSAILLAFFLAAAVLMQWAGSARSRSCGARAAGRHAAGLGLLLPRSAAAAPRHRRAGGAVPRGARAVAAGDAPQRGRGEPPGNASESAALVRRVGRAGASRRAQVDAAHASRGSRCGATPRRWRGGRGRRCWPSCSGPRSSATRSRRSCSCAASGGGAVPHRGHAGQRDRAEGRGPDDHRRARRVRTPRTWSLMVRRTPTGEFEAVPLVRE